MCSNEMIECIVRCMVTIEQSSRRKGDDLVSAAQVDADPSSRKRVALRSEQDIARMTGRSNIVSKARPWPPKS